MMINTCNPTRRHAPTRQWTWTPCCAAMLLILRRVGASARLGQLPNFTVPVMNRSGIDTGATLQVFTARGALRIGSRPRAPCLCIMNSQGMQARAGVTC